MKNGWPKIKLGELDISYFKGISPKNKDPEGDVVLVPSGAVFPDGINFSRTKRFCSSTANVRGKILNDGDILLNCGGVGTLGRSSIFLYNSITDKAVPDSFVLVIRSKNTNVLNKYIFYFFQTEFVKNKIIDNTRGTTGITSIRTEAILGFQIPVPNIREQQRIVGILKEAFDGIATAKAKTEENIKNSRDIYISTLESFFPVSSDNRNTIELGDLIETLTDYHANGSYEVLKQNVELKDTEDYAWMVRSTDFEKNFEKGMRYISKSSYEFLAKSRILGGEIIMSKIGNAGKVYLMPKITRPCSLAMNLFLIRVDEKRASNKFVYRYLKSERGERQILSKLNGTATQTITKESVRSLRIPVIPRDMQDRIVLKLESVSSETQRLEYIYQQKIAALDALKKSLLDQAFTGNL